MFFLARLDNIVVSEHRIVLLTNSDSSMKNCVSVSNQTFFVKDALICFVIFIKS